MKTITNIALTIIALGLAVWLFFILREPIITKARNKVIKEARIQKMEEIKKALFAYKEVKNEFTSNWDSLIQVIKRDKFTIVKTLGDPDDSTVIIKRDTFYVSILDSIFPKRYPIDSLPYIPMAQNKNAKFKLECDKINQRGVDVYVFQLTDTEPFDPEHVLIMGSLFEVNYSGNWK